MHGRHDDLRVLTKILPEGRSVRFAGRVDVTLARVEVLSVTAVASALVVPDVCCHKELRCIDFNECQGAL